MRELQPLKTLIHNYLRQSDQIVWDRFSHFDSLPEKSGSPRLTPHQLEAVKTAFLIEDHIPGYATEYFRIFPVDESVPPEQAAWNREIQHFIFRWCAEEDRHAHVLNLYLESTGQVSPEALLIERIKEGKKAYRAPHDDHFQLFTYTLLQEKATQIFYMSLRKQIDDPILKEILLRLAQDEARHCHFFTEAVRIGIQTKETAAIPLLQDTIDRFKMPLAGILENYKRRSIIMKHAAGGYHHASAFDYFKKVLERYATAGPAQKNTLWEDFLGALPLVS
jgi:acyl-[acyl-carrier-protein] desaturase